MNTTHEIIQEGDIVVMYASRNQYKTIKVTKGKIYQCVYGIYPHDSIIGRKYGEEIQSKDKKGYLYALQLTPSLYTLVLQHRTQVLYHQTIAPVLEYFDITPNSTIVESGTGSGCLSVAFASRLKYGNTIGNGHLYTYEFHEERKKKAEEDFADLGLDQVITVVLRDVVGNGFLIENQLNEGDADCVFLDLPNVHEAIPHAHKVLRVGGKICCFCISIEQVQKSCDELRKDGKFTNILTKEYVTRPYSIRGVFEKNSKQSCIADDVLVHPINTTKGHVGYVTFAMKVN